jgi:hypothetical protein
MHGRMGLASATVLLASGRLQLLSLTPAGSSIGLRQLGRQADRMLSSSTGLGSLQHDRKMKLAS